MTLEGQFAVAGALLVRADPAHSQLTSDHGVYDWRNPFLAS